MKPEARAHLYDVREAARAVEQFVAGRSFDDYLANDQLRSAVERKFEIMGEALNRLRRDDPDLLPQIRSHREIVSFRNILAHGYDAIDDQIVWDIVQNHLAALKEDVERLMMD